MPYQYIFIFMLIGCFTNAQINQNKLQEIYHNQLSQSDKSYEQLSEFSSRIGARPIGSVGYRLAIAHIKKTLDRYHLNYSVTSYPVHNKRWIRGIPELSHISSGNTTTPITLSAAKGSVATPPTGISKPMIVIHNMDELEKITADQMNDKILFINQPADPKILDHEILFESQQQQTQSLIKKAITLGAKAIIVRSFDVVTSDTPKMIAVSYKGIDPNQRIPVACISVDTAQLIDSIISLNPQAIFYFNQSCKTTPTPTVRGLQITIKGQRPNKTITMVNYLSSWAIGKGILQHGATLNQSIEVLKYIKENGYKPKNNIVLRLLPSPEYNIKNTQNQVFIYNHTHGTMPRKITFNTDDKTNDDYQSVSFIKSYFLENGIYDISKNSVKNRPSTTITLSTDNQRYYKYIYTDNDEVKIINPREYAMGIAGLTALIYLLDE